MTLVYMATGSATWVLARLAWQAAGAVYRAQTRRAEAGRRGEPRGADR